MSNDKTHSVTYIVYFHRSCCQIHIFDERLNDSCFGRLLVVHSRAFQTLAQTSSHLKEETFLERLKIPRRPISGEQEPTKGSATRGASTPCEVHKGSLWCRVVSLDYPQLRSAHRAHPRTRWHHLPSRRQKRQKLKLAQA